ncbi:unnamed protein product [Amoebophrya sp. A25]|nr:unnamed protein product [Amoebophrya sp. A25]|eukprot:GSA25T00001537001.1
MFQKVVLPRAAQAYLKKTQLDTHLQAGMNETNSAMPEDAFGDLALRLASKLEVSLLGPEFRKLRVLPISDKDALSKLTAQDEGGGGGSPSSVECEVVMDVRGAPVRIHSFSIDVGETEAGGWMPSLDELKVFCAALFMSNRRHLLDLGMMFESAVMDAIFETVGDETGCGKHERFALEMQGHLILAHEKIRSNEPLWETLVNYYGGSQSSSAPKKLDASIPSFFCCKTTLKKPPGSGGEEAGSAGSAQTGFLPCFGLALPWTAALQDETEPFDAPGIRTSLPRNAWRRMEALKARLEAEARTKAGEFLTVDEASGGLTTENLPEALALLREAADAIFVKPVPDPGPVPKPKYTFTPVICIPDAEEKLAIPEAVLATNPNLRIYGKPEPFDQELYPGILQSPTGFAVLDAPLGYGQRNIQTKKTPPKFGFSNSLFVDCSSVPKVCEANFPFLDVILASDCAILEGGTTEAMADRFAALVDRVSEEHLPQPEDA